jgi:hypothetical protein
VHVNQFGYLYRREGQNRTETNTTERHRQQFLGKIMSLFPGIYKGDRPVACCGKGGGSKISNNGSISTFSIGGSAKMAASVGVQGMVKIQYIGKQVSSTWYGDVTNAPYIFGIDRPKGWVDKRDVGSKEEKKGFLSKKDRDGNFIFKVVTDNKAEEVVEKKPEGELVTAIEGISVADTVEQPEMVTVMKGQSVGMSEAAPNRFDSSLPPKAKSIDSSELSVEQIKSLELSKEEWQELYKDELAGRNRKGAVAFLEDKIANWPT